MTRGAGFNEAQCTLDECFGDIPLKEQDADKGQALSIDEKQAGQYLNIPGTALTNVLKRVINNPARVDSPRRGQIRVSEHYLTKDTVIAYKGKGGEYTISVECIARRIQNGVKIFNFLLQKLNEQSYRENTEFLLKELVDVGIYANTDSAYRGLKSVLDKLMRIYVEGRTTSYEGRKRKEKISVKTTLIALWKVTYNQCNVILSPIIRESAQYITILPRWGYALPSENAYLLLDYTFSLARQNTDKIQSRGYFTISLDTIRIHLGLPAPDDVKKNHDSHYDQLIVEPIENAITIIEDGQLSDDFKDLRITPIYSHDYKNIYEYLSGHLEIRLSGEAFGYMVQRATEHKKQFIAAGKRMEAAKRKALSKKLEVANREPPSAQCDLPSA